MRQMRRPSRTRSITVAVVLLFVSGALVVAAAPARADTAAGAVCEPSATVTAVEGTWGTAISSVDRLRFTVRKKSRVFKVRATATLGVSANLGFEVRGVVDRCTDGVSSPESVTVTMVEETNRSFRGTAVARHRAVKTARRTAHRAAVRAANRASLAIFDALDAAGRANAQAELSKLLGPAPTSP